MAQDFLGGANPADVQDPDQGDEAYAGDQSEVEFGYVELPAEGDYECVVNGMQTARSKSSGAPQIILAIASPECPGAASKYYITNTPGGKWRFDADLRVFAVEPPQKGEPARKYLPAEFVGKKVIGHGKHDRYNGRLSFKFDFLSVHPEGAGARAWTPEGAE